LLEDGKITTQLLRDGAGALIGRFTNPAMRYYGNITFYIEFQGLRFNQPAPTVYYTVCKRRPEDCQFDPVFALSVAGDGRAFAELPGGVATMENAREYVLGHDPRVCNGNGDACTYVFAVQNDYNYELIVSQRASASFGDPGNILLSRSYVNEL
jgi:hypothetical protein